MQGLKVIDLQQHDYMRTLELAVQHGLPVLLQNVHEKLDPALDPVLNKSIVKIGIITPELLSQLCSIVLYHIVKLHVI